ncbi:MAG: hypothetical protein RQ736_01535 [Thiogranum sp.]|nr:hypothetical protein [Thiogranum sp.]
MNNPANDRNEFLAILLDGELQLKYDRSTGLPEHQLQYLERMDQQMTEGIRLGVDWVEQPDLMQRAKFVALHLVASLQHGNDALIAASCAYLAERLPELKQVRAKMLGTGFSVELVFDKPYVEEILVDFVPRRPAE